MQKTIVLIIYVLFSVSVCAQKIDYQIDIYQNKESTIPADSLLFKNLTTDKYAIIKDSIKNNFLKQGYLSLLTSNDTAQNKKLRSNIFLGPRYKTIKIKAINRSREDVDVPLSRKRENYITPDQLNTYLKDLQSELNKKGAPFAKVAFENWDFTLQDTARVFVQVTTAKKRSIDKIVVNGYPDYPKNVISNTLNKNTNYTSQNINRISSSIKDLPYLEMVKEPEALFKQDSTILYVYVKKKNTNIADGLLGFNTDDEGNLNVNGFVEASLINNLNYGEQFDFKYRNDENQQTFLDLQLTLPNILFKKIGLSTSLNITRRDSLYQNSSYKLGLSYPIRNNLINRLEYFNRNSVQETNADLQGFGTNGITTSIAYHKLSNNKLQPENIKLALTLGVYQRNIEDTQTNQFSISTTIEKLWKLNNHLNVKASSNTYLFKTSQLQFNELTQIGGTKSIRGFNQNSIDTAAYSLLQTDLRYGFNDQIFLSLINDTGVFEEFTLRKPQFLYAFGAGFGILTRAGILRLEVVNGRFIGYNNGISNTIAHLNFTIVF